MKQKICTLETWFFVQNGLRFLGQGLERRLASAEMSRTAAIPPGRGFVELKGIGLN